MDKRAVASIKAKQMNPSLCWKCIHAVPTSTCGCEWSMDHQPVEGWIAEVTNNEPDSYYYTSPYPTYHVYECPKFKESGKGRPMKDALDKNVRGLGLAVVKRALDDYRELYADYYHRKQHNVTRRKLYGLHGNVHLYGIRTSDEYLADMRHRLKVIRKDLRSEWMNSISDIDCVWAYKKLMKNVRLDERYKFTDVRKGAR